MGFFGGGNAAPKWALLDTRGPFASKKALCNQLSQKGLRQIRRTHSPNPSVAAPWFPSSSLGTRRVRSDGLGECLQYARQDLNLQPADYESDALTN